MQFGNIIRRLLTSAKYARHCRCKSTSHCNKSHHCVSSVVAAAQRYLSAEPGQLTNKSRQWRRQGEGEASPCWWTSKNYVICVCFHCHGTSSYHTTNTLQGRRAKSHVDTQKYNRDWGTSYSRPPIDPYLTPPVTNPGGATESRIRLTSVR